MLKYLNGYDTKLQTQVQMLIEEEKLGEYLLSRYTNTHSYTSDKSLYSYVMDLKNEYMKSSSPIAKVMYDTKMRDIRAALGTHTFVSRVQGGKLKAKNEIRISHIFKNVPESFLRMIVTHELAHLKVAPPVNAGEVSVGLVGAHHKVRHRGHEMVGEYRYL